jgi:hypothetical protein
MMLYILILKDFAYKKQALFFKSLAYVINRFLKKFPAFLDDAKTYLVEEMSGFVKIFFSV